jgi:SAM-dependent methyltransferase
MRLEHLPYLVCPKTARPLCLEHAVVTQDRRVRQGDLVEPVSGNRYPIVEFIPRFVPQGNYAENFGLEWNIHSRTQYDETSGFSASRDRFEKQTGWGSDLRGEYMLEVGSGAGRFTRHAIDTGALVFSCDYSSAVEANYRSNGDRHNLLLVQASVYELPFKRSFFDKAFCFGVLQHTPDPRGSFLAMVQHLKPGGSVASDIYVKNIARWLLQPKYWVRPITRKIPPRELYDAVKRYIDFMWPLARLLRKIPLIGSTLNWKLLIADYSRLLTDADDATLKQWAYLDTFDMLSPMYDQPATLRTFKRWHEESGLDDIDVHYGFMGVEGRATKSLSGAMSPIERHGSVEDRRYQHRGRGPARSALAGRG